MYFVMFTIMVFVLLWTFQILFLENFYERMKVRERCRKCGIAIGSIPTNDGIRNSVDKSK